MNSAVRLYEVWGDDEVYGPLDFEIQHQLTPMAVVVSVGFTNHLPLFKINDVIAFVYCRNEA